MFSIPLRLDKLDIYIYIYTTVNATICSLLVATVPRCKLLTWTTCFGHEDHLQVHIELSQTLRGYCLCVLSVQHNHEQWVVTVYVFYQSTVITDIERLLFMCFISPT